MKHLIKKQINKFGYDIVKKENRDEWPIDFEDLHKRIVSKVSPFTMTSRERIFGLIEATKYVIQHSIDGDIVECGVWRGGSMLAVAETLQSLEHSSKQLYLYDTFEGMPPPTKEDSSYDRKQASDLLNPHAKKEEDVFWAYSTLDTVKNTMALSSYPDHKIHYIKGKVEETIPNVIPEKICLLRLDTDWYESTKHEMNHLFPRLVEGGVIIIDDYGFWKGARKAVDEYFEEHNVKILLNRLDFTGRIGIKI